MGKELFDIALGVQEPLYIDEVAFDQTDGDLSPHLNFKWGDKFPCSECKEADLPVYDTTEKTWRHLNFFQYKFFT